MVQARLTLGLWGAGEPANASTHAFIHTNCTLPASIHSNKICLDSPSLSLAWLTSGLTTYSVERDFSETVKSFMPAWRPLCCSFVLVIASDKHLEPESGKRVRNVKHSRKMSRNKQHFLAIFRRIVITSTLTFYCRLAPSSLCVPTGFHVCLPREGTPAIGRQRKGKHTDLTSWKWSLAFLVPKVQNTDKLMSKCPRPNLQVCQTVECFTTAAVRFRRVTSRRLLLNRATGLAFSFNAKMTNIPHNPYAQLTTLSSPALDVCVAAATSSSLYLFLCTTQNGATC